MIEGQEVMERSNSPNYSPSSANKDSFITDIYGCIFQHSVYHTIFAKFSLLKPSGDPPWNTGCSRISFGESVTEDRATSVHT
jgi:hypothetical protein